MYQMKTSNTLSNVLRTLSSNDDCKRSMIKEIVKGIWQFARFLFLPQWGRNRNQG